ncbi:MAG: crossover junction endodeoxyribonuclease RuvC [Planctomycetota bacterium]
MSLRILGIDPGTHAVGYGAVEHGDGGLQHVASGTVRAPAAQLGERLAVIHAEIVAHMAQLAPDVIVLEKIFHGKNVSTLVKIGEGRGVIVLAAAQAGIPLAEYAPALVKKALCGRGAAPKEQVAFLVRHYLGLAEETELGHDATDALALAICHASRTQFLTLCELPQRHNQARTLEIKYPGQGRVSSGDGRRMS